MVFSSRGIKLQQRGKTYEQCTTMFRDAKQDRENTLPHFLRNSCISRRNRMRLRLLDMRNS